MEISVIHAGQYDIKIDAEDLPKISDISWVLTKRKAADKPYFRGWIKRPIGVILLHRLIAQCPRGMQVDHIDGDTLNNCKSNLRICTGKQNCRNTKIHKDNKSGYKGVSWHKASKKFRAQIDIDGKRKCLGYFDNPRDAALTYDTYAKLAYGEFFRGNEERL